MGDCSEIPPANKAAHRSTRCDPRRLINGILYVLTTGGSWLDVPANYGTKSTVHRHHLELCEKGVY
ncbi:MAG: transposase, partial [Ruminiclostridium sp.]|nr:transposase [Ruminiclostridium sp.]